MDVRVRGEALMARKMKHGKELSPAYISAMLAVEAARKQGATRQSALLAVAAGDKTKANKMWVLYFSYGTTVAKHLEDVRAATMGENDE